MSSLLSQRQGFWDPSVLHICWGGGWAMGVRGGLFDDTRFYLGDRVGEGFLG